MQFILEHLSALTWNIITESSSVCSSYDLLHNTKLIWSSSTRELFESSINYSYRLFSAVCSSLGFWFKMLASCIMWTSWIWWEWNYQTLIRFYHKVFSFLVHICQHNLRSQLHARDRLASHYWNAFRSIEARREIRAVGWGQEEVRRWKFWRRSREKIWRREENWMKSLNQRRILKNFINSAPEYNFGKKNKFVESLEKLFDYEDCCRRQNRRPDIGQDIFRSVAQMMIANLANAQVDCIASLETWIFPWTSSGARTNRLPVAIFCR